jgi:two-component system NtrC family response regulator
MKHHSPDNTEGNLQPEVAAWQEASVLIIGGQATERGHLQRSLARQCALVEAVDSGEKAQQLVSRCHFDIMVMEANPGDDTALAQANSLRSQSGNARVIFTSGQVDSRAALKALRSGVSDILLRPFEMNELLTCIRRNARKTETIGPAIGPRPAKIAGRHTLVGDSLPIRHVKALVERIAPSKATVLIEGETGTGKELVARLLHNRSGRRGTFVPVNCAAIAPELLESELFGHTKGAFTNAHHGREGLFVSARGGTMFLDEISEMPLDMEVKLLRAIEESAIRPVGSDRELPIDSRIVASTQHDLANMVRERRFREDLYYRLNVIHIQLPPLRERREDIPALANHFVKSLSLDLGVPALELDSRTLSSMQEHHWPGNVRELKNVIERGLLLGKSPAQFLQAEEGAADRDPKQADGYPTDWTLEQVKTQHMMAVLQASGGNKSAAARRLGISRKTLERKLPQP